jgi:hypothetical protein
MAILKSKGASLNYLRKQAFTLYIYKLTVLGRCGINFKQMYINSHIVIFSLMLTVFHDELAV